MMVLRGRESAGIRRLREPITTGVPLPRGLAREASELRLRTAAGTGIPAQREVLDRWPDGTIRWLLLDFQVDAEPDRELALELVVEEEPERPVASSLRIEADATGFRVDTGAARFAVSRDGFAPLGSVQVEGAELLDPLRSGWDCMDAAGRSWTPRVRIAEAERSGPLRATLRVEGDLAAGVGRPLLEFVARLDFFAGLALVRVTLTVRNPRRAAHPGGHWELGDAGSVLFRDLSLRFAPAKADRVSWSTDPAAPLEEARGNFDLYQDSSGGENWRSPVHRTRDGGIPTRFRGFVLRTGDAEREGERAAPRVVLHDGRSGVSVSMRQFWQNFPKGIRAADGVLRVELFPAEFAALHELQGGEQKTHELWLAFGPSALAPSPDFARAPLRLHPDPEWFAASGVFPYLTVSGRDTDETWSRLVSQALDGDSSFAAKRERADEFGWRHFGELWADHESKYHEGPEIFVSHYNNQYDVVYGALLQLARTGDPRWFEIAGDLVRHVIDVDVYHTDEDRPAYSRGLFWHTAHYVDAGLSTHRSYPSGHTGGGGPSNEHNYAAGFACWWFLTGDPDAWAAAVERAAWVIAADDGTRTRLALLDRRSTGLASRTRDDSYHGPGRGAGNSLACLLDGWRLTGDERFFDKAVEIVHRTIHPGDDPDAMGLADSETRWSYTACLQELARFLDELAAAGRLGEPYAYARASLLTYARWMAASERPALEFPERLDHPTETWAAQDLRKSEVFRFASLHARGEERERFRERAEFFFRHSLDTLDRFPTRSCTRPISLMMRYGLAETWFRRNPDASRPEPQWRGTFAPRRPFVPQRTAALRKLAALVVVASSLAVVAAGWLITR
ncbi:MAG: hypothetical protein ACT4PE_16735 [Candidatus Eiseniibacteriota bacterium]